MPTNFDNLCYGSELKNTVIYDNINITKDIKNTKDFDEINQLIFKLNSVFK